MLRELQRTSIFAMKFSIILLINIYEKLFTVLKKFNVNTEIFLSHFQMFHFISVSGNFEI